MTNKKCNLIIVTYFLGYNFLYSIIANFIVGLNAGNDDLIMLVIYGLILLNFVIIAKDFLKKEFNKFIINLKSYVVPIIKYFFLHYFAIFASSLFISIFFSLNNTANNIIVENSLSQLPISTIFSAVIFAPIVEELVFRKAIFTVFCKKNIYTGIIVSSLLFGFLHVYSSIFTQDFADLVNILTYSASGFVLCKASIDNDNLFCSIAIHLLNNMIGVIALL